MYLLEFKFNEPKIEADGEYELAEFYRVIRIMFARHNLPEMETTDGSLWFKDNGGEQDYGAMWGITLSLSDEEWFAKYIEKMYWYDDERQPGVFDYEDVLATYREEKVGAFNNEN